MSSERTMTSPTKIMFLACGSFSPPTPMHLRMFGKNFFDIEKLLIFYLHSLQLCIVYFN